MKKTILFLLITVLCLGLFGCGGNTDSETTDCITTDEETTASANESVSTTENELTTDEGTTVQESSSADANTTAASADNADSGIAAAVFTNKYGTASTKCKISGCENYIAKSGDTDCCEIHSVKCGTCQSYLGCDTASCSFCHTADNEHHEEPDHNTDGAFTNKHGTASTICRIDGCDNFIARHGDTDCCEIHSDKCRDCGSLIGCDNTYCSLCSQSSSGHHGESGHNSGNKH